MQDYVFYARPSEFWVVEFSNLSGNRVVEVVGTEYAARRAAEQYEAAEQFGVEAAVLLCSSTDFHSVTTSAKLPGGNPITSE
jgi:hypothetical protein